MLNVDQKQVAAAATAERDINDIIHAMREYMDNDRDACSWGKVASLNHARNLLVEAAFALGAIDEADAADYGVDL